MLLDGTPRVGADPRANEWHIEAPPPADIQIDPDIEIAMNDPPGPEVPIDLQESILPMGLQQDAPFADDLDPALDHRDQDLVDNERFGVGAQPLDHLDQQRRIAGMLEIASVERDARNEKPPRLARTRNCLPHQKPPCVLVPAERQPEHIREICESVHADMRDVPRNDDAVFDVLAPEPAVEARDAAWKVELDEMKRNVARILKCEYRPGRGGGSDQDRSAARTSLQFVEVLDPR